MAASMPFDPFWKFVLNEDSDGEEYVDERRRKDETIVKKVRFKLPRHEPAATDDSMSLMKFVSMDLGPQEPEPEKRSFFRKDTKDTRDDDDSWSLLNASFTDENKERGARRRGKEKREETVKSHGCLTPAPDDSKSTGGNGRGNSILRRGSIRNSEKSSFRSLFKKGPIFPDEGDTEEKPGDSMSSFLPTNLLSSSQPPPEHKTKALAKQEAKAKPTTKARIERITVTQTTAARKQSDSQAAAGIAAAGATTTSELFEAQPAPKSRRALPVDQDIEKRKTMDFWDMFSASDDDDDTDDGSFSGSSYASDGTEESESTNTDVVIQSQFVIQSQVRETLSEKDDSPRSISGTADALLENHPSKSGDAAAQNDDQSLVDEQHDHLPSKKGIGRIVCCSVKDLNGRQDFFDRGVSNRTCGQRSRYVQPDVPLYPLYPGVKMVGDEDTNNVVVTSGKVNRWHESHTAFPPDVIESSKGPQSLYAYDYDSRTYMGAQYETYGSRSVINIQNEAPFQTHKREKGEVTVQIEVSSCVHLDPNSGACWTYPWCFRRLRRYLIQIAVFARDSGGEKANQAFRSSQESTLSGKLMASTNAPHLDLAFTMETGSWLLSSTVGMLVLQRYARTSSSRCPMMSNLQRRCVLLRRIFRPSRQSTTASDSSQDTRRALCQESRSLFLAS